MSDINKLVLDNIGLAFGVARHHSKRYRYTHIDEEDIAQAGCIGLISAARTFKPELNNAFSTYATKCIYTEVSRLFRRPRSIEALSIHHEINGELLVEDLIGVDDDSTSPEVKEFLAQLSAVDLAIIKSLLEGYKQSEIARATKSTRQAISARVSRMKKRWRDMHAD